jgi:hypothetical protein
MTPSRKPFLPRGEAQRMLPGLEYARTLIDTAMLICRHVEEEPPPAPAQADSEASSKGN